ncbi:hypothetical protein Tco_1290143, partial [Tanacetum coccineum]
MASAIISLTTNQKFNFSKFIIESKLKNLENVSGKFLMYPRFMQVFLDKQLEGMPTHNRIYITPSHTKKIFGNMRRVGNGFSGRETPLFQTIMVQDQAEMGEGSAMPTDLHNTSTILHPSTSQPPRELTRMDTKIPQSSGPTDNVADEAINEEMDDSLERAATTATSLDEERDRGNINKTQSKATPNEASSQGTTSGGGPRRQETMGDTIAQTRFENVSKHSNDPLLARGNTLRSGEDSLKLKELMELYTNLQIRVLDLEKKKTTQAEEIGRINAIDLDEDITLVNDQDDADMFNVNTLTGDEVLAEPKVFVKDVNLTVDEVTLAQAIAVLKSVKPKVKANVVEEPSIPVSVASIKVSVATSTTTTTISSQPSQAKVQDKGKGILVEEPVKTKKKDLIRLDEEIASKLQAKFDEEETLAREKDEANVALTEEWDDIQAKVDVDYQLAQRL